MPQYDNNNSGVLFKNDEKETEKQPDYRGKAEVGGEEYWLSAWLKQGKRGKFLSLAFTIKQAKSQQNPDWVGESPSTPDDDIPF